jgi:multicomponent Na+:H+ antiporter subunit C
VIGVGITALALAIIVTISHSKGTIDIDELTERGGAEE